MDESKTGNGGVNVALAASQYVVSYFIAPPLLMEGCRKLFIIASGKCEGIMVHDSFEVSTPPSKISLFSPKQSICCQRSCALSKAV